MFSLFLIGNTFKRKHHTFNIIFGSAIVLIFHNPKIIFEVGFQLSYAAVIGIVCWYPILKDIFISKYKVINYFIELSAISIAAQFATLPISIYYFNQFPVWFLLSNWIAVPLAGILYSGGLIIVLSNLFSENLAIFLGGIFDHIITWFIASLNWIQELPYSTIDVYSPSLVVIILIFISYISLTQFIIHPSKKQLKICFTLIAVLCFSKVAQTSILQNEKEQLLIYYDRNQLSLDYIHPKFIQAINLNVNEVNNIKEKLRSLHFKKKRTASIELNTNQFKFGTKNFVIYSKEHRLENLPDTIHYLIADNIEWIDFKAIHPKHPIKNLVITAACKNYKAKKYWKKYAGDHGIEVYDIGKDGAMKIEADDVTTND